MAYRHISFILGLMLIFFSFAMLPPMLVNHIYAENNLNIFLYSFAFVSTFGCCLTLIGFNYKKEIQIHDGFLLVVLFWGMICFFAAIPFFLTLHPVIGVIDCLFEAVSGLTTTGATILDSPETLPKAILFYRQQLQFLGGMSIVVLTVAIMPMLGIGGTRLYRTETPGSFKDNKFTPRITQTAKALWTVYLLLTISCILFFKFAGVDWFEAICEAFATISTGGLMTKNSGLGHYNNPMIEWGAPLFMLAGSVNFGLHYLALKRKNLIGYWQEEEFRHFFYILLFTIIFGGMIYFHIFNHLSVKEFRRLYFTIVSVITSSGSSCTNYAEWPLPLIFILIMVSIIGGCHGSTSGGIKVIRTVLLGRFYLRELKVLLHPQAITLIKFNQKPLDNNILLSLFAFISAFLGLYIVMIFFMTAFGNDFLTSIALVTGTLSNSGIGIANVADSYANINSASKVTCIISMLAGRLEIFSLFIVFSPGFWKN
jgi:trk system potassium uptake protein TrkH